MAATSASQDTAPNSKSGYAPNAAIMFGAACMIFGAGIAWGPGGMIFALGLWFTIACLVQDLAVAFRKSAAASAS